MTREEQIDALEANLRNSVNLNALFLDAEIAASELYNNDEPPQRVIDAAYLAALKTIAGGEDKLDAFDAARDAARDEAWGEP